MEVVETSCCTVSNVCYTCQCFARVDGPVEMLLKVEQGRAGQGRAGQGRAGQGRTQQDQPGQDRAHRAPAHIRLKLCHTSPGDAINTHEPSASCRNSTTSQQSVQQ